MIECMLNIMVDRIYLLQVYDNDWRLIYKCDISGTEIVLLLLELEGHST
jgi:hypothetical protein